MKAAYPAYCPGQDCPVTSRNAAEAFYAEKGFRVFDRTDDWTLMRVGALEAYVRPANKMRVGWVGSVIQLHHA